MTTSAQLTPNALLTLQKRYLLPGETPEDLFRRVAKHIAKAEKEDVRLYWEEIFFHLMSDLTFYPNSPCLKHAGTDKGCLSACFVLSPQDTLDSIYQIVTETAKIQQWGGGTGHGLSLVRREGAKIKTTQKGLLTF